MAQLDHILGQVSQTEGLANGLGIVMRFELIRRRLQLGESPLENYALEARLQAVASDTPAIAEAEPPAEELLLASLFAFTRRLIGEEPLPKKRSLTLSDLERAYLWERNRRYPAALEIYDRLLTERDTAPRLKPVIELHRAFCLGMIGELEEARATARELTTVEPGSGVVAVAREMIRFLDLIVATQRRIRDEAEGPFELGRRLYFAMDYTGSTAVFGEFLGRQAGDPRSAEARYYMARSIEELGGIEEAVREYRRAVLLDPEGSWAREANRRLVMIGSFYRNDPELSERATLALQLLGDQEFSRTVEPFRQLAVPEPLPEERAEAGPTGADAAERGEIFVRTSPLQAFVSIDGVPVGPSPVFIPEVPFGEVVLQAVSEPYAGELRLNVDTSAIIPVTIELHIPRGAIRIETVLGSVEVFLDDRLASRTGRLTLEGIEPGSHIVVVRGVDSTGRLVFWENEVDVAPGATTVLRVP
jgi:tetratricopeptide (TPR) repeat protein